MSDVAFRKVMLPGSRFAPSKTFYQIVFRESNEARRYGLRLDPYPEENWGGVPVEWTRPEYEQRIECRGDLLELKYWIGHLESIPSRHVRVDIMIDGEPVYTHRHDRNETGLARLELPNPSGRSFVLGIRVTPGWRAKEGRNLGIGLYPLKWDR